MTDDVPNTTSNQETELQRVYKLVDHWYGETKRLRAALERIGNPLLVYARDEDDDHDTQLSMRMADARAALNEPTCAVETPQSSNESGAEIAQFVADCRKLIAHSRTFYEVRDALSKAVAIIESGTQPVETTLSHSTCDRGDVCSREANRLRVALAYAINTNGGIKPDDCEFISNIAREGQRLGIHVERSAVKATTTNQDGQQTPAPSGHAGLGTTGEASSPLQSSVKASSEPELMNIAYERHGRCLWHTNCDRSRSGIMAEVRREETCTLLRCLSCDREGYFPVGATWACVSVEPRLSVKAPVQHTQDCQFRLTTELHFKDPSACTCGAVNGTVPRTCIHGKPVGEHCWYVGPPE